MFSSLYFAPAVLETTDGETVWEILPRLFYRPTSGSEIEIVDFFVHERPEEFISPRYLVDAPSRADLEIDEAMAIHLTDLLAHEVGLTARSTHFHNESYLGPYFVPALVAHGVHFGQLDQRGIPYIDRMRQTFLNAEVANSVTDLDEEANELILAASWLCATPYLRPHEFYRKITIDDIDYWNVEQPVVNVLRKLDWKSERQGGKRNSLSSDTAARTIRLAYLAELSSRPIKIPPVQDFLAVNQDERLPSTIERLDKYQFKIQSEILELGVVSEHDDWFYQCVDTPPTSMRGPYASDESEIQIRQSRSFYKPRWTLPAVDTDWSPGNPLEVFKNPSTFYQHDGATQIGAAVISGFLLSWEHVSMIPPVAQIALLDASQCEIAESKGPLVDLTDLTDQFVPHKISMIQKLFSDALRFAETNVFENHIQTLLEELTDDELVYLKILTQTLGSSPFSHWLFAGEQSQDLTHALPPHFWTVYKTVAMAISDRGETAESLVHAAKYDAQWAERFLVDAFRDGKYEGTHRNDSELDGAWYSKTSSNKTEVIRVKPDRIVAQIDNMERIAGFCRLVWALAEFAREEISVSLEVPRLFLEFRIRKDDGETIVSCFAENDFPSPLAVFGRKMEARGWKRTPFSQSGPQRIGIQFEKRGVRIEAGNFLAEFVDGWCCQNGDPWSRSKASAGTVPRPFQVRAWSRDQWAQQRMNLRIAWITRR